MINRVILIVLDSVGIGNAPDASKYGDEGSSTLGSIVKNYKNFNIPNLQKLGLGNIDASIGLPVFLNPIGAYGKATEASAGKDTTTGHWEIAGLQLNIPFPTFSNGFPKEIIAKFENEIGTKTLGNYAASGTEIIKELGKMHIETRYPIVYTSADSVFQIAAHEEIIPVNKLYEICISARKILNGKYAVGRVIARPFIGNPGNFTRTTNRKDFSIMPFHKTVLNHVSENNMEVVGIGKIEDIFAGYGITKSAHTKSNNEGVKETIHWIKKNFKGLIFTNLVDFDSLFGHRRDVKGYANALMEFDSMLPEILKSLKDDDILILTADHGNDPSFKGTDHTREQVPILIYGKNIKPGSQIGTRESFADMGATIADLLSTKHPLHGKSFKNEILLKKNSRDKACLVPTTNIP